MTNRKIEYWVIPPEADAEFVANMEEVLEIYAKPYDRTHPVLCMDEQPVQLIKETRKPIEATAKHPRASIMVRAQVQRVFSCSRNPSQVGEWRLRVSRERKLIGHSKWRDYWTVATRGATK